MALDTGSTDGVVGGAGADLIIDTTTATFMADVVEASKTATILVDFWAPWCGPCKQLTPVLEKVVREAGGKVKLVKMNIDDHPTIPGQMGVQSIPTVYAFKDGKPVDAFQGSQTESQIKAFIDALAGSDGLDGAPDLSAAIDAAEQSLSEGDLTGAVEIYASVLQEDPQHMIALTGLAKCYVKAGEITRAEETLSLVPPDQQSEEAVISVRAAIDLARKAEGAGDLSELESKVAAKPDDHQTRFDLAVAMGAAGNKESAVEHLIEILKQDRKWNEEAARKQLVQFFEVWGHGDTATVEGRKQMSTILFS